MINCIENESHEVRFDPEFGKFYISDNGTSGTVCLSTQDVADLLSIAHTEKVKKDIEYRKQHEDNTNNSSTKEKSG